MQYDEMYPSFGAILLLFLAKAMNEKEAPQMIHHTVWKALVSKDLRDSTKEFFETLESHVSFPLPFTF